MAVDSGIYEEKLNQIIPVKNMIDGALVNAISTETIENVNPALNVVFTTIPNSDQADIEQAVIAAKMAYPHWASLSRQERSTYLMRIAELIEDDLEFLAYLESIDNGKPFNLAKTVDIPRAISNFKFFATAILHYSSETHETDNLALNYTIRKPIGVVGCISPWNLPLYLFTWKIAPALAAGNTVVAKPSEITPLTAHYLSHICIKAGLPKGVLNIVHGLGPKVGEAMTLHPEIKAISFTGGTVTGSRIAKNAAPLFKKLSLELGGKNPNIIFADCNFDEMITTTLRSSFANQGEICLCGSRIFIERSIYEKFKMEFVNRVEKLVVGDPLEENPDLGAIVSKQHFEKILSYVKLAKEEGGSILSGGHSVDLEGKVKNGFFIRPTIIDGLPFTCRTNQEEIFGPVVTLTPFDTEEEVLEMANSTKYGLSATIWTENVSRIHRIISKLDSGIIWVNCWLFRDLRTPFGGMKASGVGREGGNYALDFFTEPKNVTIKYYD